MSYISGSSIGRGSTRASVAMEPPYLDDRASETSVSSAWALEEIKHEGKAYLLDRQTGIVYKDSPEDQWPEPVGKLEGGRVTFRQRQVRARRTLPVGAYTALRRAFDGQGPWLSGPWLSGGAQRPGLRRCCC